jgi:hypothetical protein
MKPIDILKQQNEFTNKVIDLFWEINEAFNLDAEEFHKVSFECCPYNFSVKEDCVYFHYRTYSDWEKDIEFTFEEFNIMIDDFNNSIVKITSDKRERERNEKKERDRIEKEEQLVSELKYQEKLNELAKSYGVTNPIEYEKALKQLKYNNGRL